MFWTVTLPTVLAVVGLLLIVARLAPRFRAFATLDDTPAREPRWDWDAEEVDRLWPR